MLSHLFFSTQEFLRTLHSAYTICKACPSSLVQLYAPNETCFRFLGAHLTMTFKILSPSFQGTEALNLYLKYHLNGWNILVFHTQPPAVIPLLAWDSLHQDLENLIRYSSLEDLTLTVNSALQLKYQCLWQANSIIADTASLRRGPTFLLQCTQGLAWLPLNSLQCTVRANLSCRKQEMGLPWQQSTF